MEVLFQRELFSFFCSFKHRERVTFDYFIKTVHMFGLFYQGGEVTSCYFLFILHFGHIISAVKGSGTEKEQHEQVNI